LKQEDADKKKQEGKTSQGY